MISTFAAGRRTRRRNVRSHALYDNLRRLRKNQQDQEQATEEVRVAMLPEQLRTVLLWAVLIVWICNFAAGLIPPLDYEPIESINGIFMAIFGGVLALGARKGRSDE